MAIFGLAAITFGQTVPSYVPTIGLVGWWPFNGNAIDSSGNTNNGTVNGATLTTDRFGNTNSAYSFDGISNYISTADIDLQNTATISIWVYPIGTIGALVDKDMDANSNSGYVFLYNNSNPYGLYAHVGWSGNANNNIFPSNNNLLLNQWHHCVLTLNNGTAKIYVDGLLVYTQTSVNPTTQNNDLLLFGKSVWGGNLFSGKLDDIGIWNRALDSCEVKDLYFASLGNCCNISVTTQPINQSVNISNNAQFTTASSDPLATYQWQTDLGVGFQNLNSVGQYSGTTNDTLTIANTTLSNNNQPFRCIVSSGSCTDTSAIAVLTVVNNTGINEVSQSNLFSVYPNPANSQINVKADAKLLGSIYTVYDNTGKLVLTGKINSENTVIELGNLSGGIYMFNVGGNLKQTFKVIKE